MKRLYLVAIGLGLHVVSAGGLRADWLFFANGEACRIQSVEIGERLVHVITLTGQSWVVLRDTVDVESTLAANRSSQPAPSPAPPAVPVAAPPATLPSPEPPPEAPRREPPPPAIATLPPPAPTVAPAPMVLEQSIPAPLLPPAPLPPQARLDSEFFGDPETHRFAAFVNGSLNTAPLEFGESQTFELFSEEANILSQYRDPSHPGIELGALYLVKGGVGLQASVELFQNDREAAYQALLPHPFFYDSFRELSGIQTNLSHRETAVHLDAVLSKSFGRHFSIDIFGGPSFFMTRTELLTDVLYEEVFPFNEVISQGIEVSGFEDRPWGFNVGGAATFRIRGSLGMDFSFRYSRARVSFVPQEGRAVEFDAGGARAGAGLRFLFP